MTLRHLIPSLVVVALAILGPATAPDPTCPAGTDGPQFRCWLEEQ